MKKQIKDLFTWPVEKPNVPPSEHCWFGEDHIRVIGGLIDQINPKYVLEMGSWTGAGSTQYILNKAPFATLVCIDHWSKDVNDYLQEGQTAEGINTELGHVIESLWETFLVNTWNYRERLIPLRKRTTDGLQILEKLNIPFELIYIDAHHDYESVLHDIQTAHKLWPNAIIVGDDYTWGTVKRAVDEYAGSNDLEVVVSYTCWYLKTK